MRVHVPSRHKRRLLALLFGVGVAVAIVVVLAAGAEFAARAYTKSGHDLVVDGAPWLDGFEHVTVGDPELGIALRPGIRARWHGADVRVNASGHRSRSNEGETPARLDGELLVFVVGDSNAFGHFVDYEETYASLLERALRSRTEQPVRVVNLGVSGYSSFQARLALGRWLHLGPDVVVFADSCNNRGPGVPERAETIAEVESGYRIWELGEAISYALLLASKRLNPDVRSQPPLGQGRPTVRVSRDRYRTILEDVIASARRAGTSLVFLATGDDPTVADTAGRGLDHLEREDFDAAAVAFAGLVRERPRQSLGWILLEQAEMGAGADTTRLARRYAESGAGLSYIRSFGYYADEYLPVMEEAARAAGVPLVDMRPVFRDEQVGFRDVCHFGPRGHPLIADALADAILGSRAPARNPGRSSP